MVQRGASPRAAATAYGIGHHHMRRLIRERFGDAPSNQSAQHRAVLRACRRARRLPVRWHSDACRDKRARRYRLWQQIVMTEKRQYSKAEKAAWGAEQDRIRAAGGIKAWRAQQGISEPTPAKRQSRAKPLIADTSESECFDSLVYRKGLVTAVFSKGGGAGTYEYEMSLAEAREWFADPSLGEYFNAEIR